MYYAPVEGSPLLPLDFVTIYFSAFLLVLALAYFALRIADRKVHFTRHLAVVGFFALALKTAAIGGGSILAAYWLLPAPHLAHSSLASYPGGYPTEQKIEFKFDRPVSRKAMEKTISPEVPGVWMFESSTYRTHLLRTVVFYPTRTLAPDTVYTVTLTNIQNTLRSSKPYSRQFTFNTQALPAVADVTPKGESSGVSVSAPIEIALSSPLTPASEFQFAFSPPVEFETSLDASRTRYTLTPAQPLRQGTQYALSVRRASIIRDLQTGEVVSRTDMEEVYAGSFLTEGVLAEAPAQPEAAREPTIAEFVPAQGWTGVSEKSSVRVTFNQEVDKTSAESRFSISPLAAGALTWEGNTLIFTPFSPFPQSITFKVSIAPGVKSAAGLDSAEAFAASFTTVHSTTKLAVPAYLQKYGLSCEAAALRMALSFYGVKVSEDTLLEKIGVDPTPHAGNVWGNPYLAFVGNVKGKQMVDGYGVYWGPIAQVAREFRDAHEFEGWTLGQLTKALADGHPVVIWTYSKNGTPTEWQTPLGHRIFAVRDEHAVTVAGFVGSPDNPSQFIVNDPLVGQV